MKVRRHGVSGVRGRVWKWKWNGFDDVFYGCLDKMVPRCAEKNY